jgi:hypothetical protein
MQHHPFDPEHLALTRRDFLHRCGMGMGALGLSGLAGQLGMTPRAVANDAGYTNAAAAVAFSRDRQTGYPHFRQRGRVARRYF